MKQVILGEEHDGVLLRAFDAVLKDKDVRVLSDTSGHYGSQELREVRYELLGREMLVEIETFIGFSVHGDATSISRLIAYLNREGADLDADKPLSDD